MDNLEVNHYISFDQKNEESERKKLWEYYRDRCIKIFENTRDYYLNYKIINGELNEDDYTYVTNPLSTNNPNLKGYPAKMRNYDIISPLVQLKAAEKASRVNNKTVVCTNLSQVSHLQEAHYELVKKYLYQEATEALLQLQEEIATRQENEQAKEEVEQLKQMYQQMEQKLNADKIETEVSNEIQNIAVMLADIKEYLMKYCNIKVVTKKLFKDKLANDVAITYKWIENDEICYTDVSPVEISYYMNEEETNLRKAAAVIRTRKVSDDYILEAFKDCEDYEKVEEYIGSGTGSSFRKPSLPTIFTGESNSFLNRYYQTEETYESTFTQSERTLSHLVFKSKRKLKIVTRIELDGNMTTFEADEDYILEPLLGDINVEEKWVSCYMEMYVIDDLIQVDLKYIPLFGMKYEDDNCVICPYASYIRRERHTEPNPFARRALPHQIMVNIITYQVEKAINQNKSVFTIFPVNLIAEEAGYDLFTSLYYADALSVLPVDLSNPEAATAAQHIRAVNMSKIQYVKDLFDMRLIVRRDFEESIGINPQRKGEISASAGKGTTQEAIFRSYLMSEDEYSEFEDFEVQELQDLLSLSKYAWKKGKSQVFRTSDFRTVYLKVHPERYSDMQLGVFATNSKEEDDALNIMKQQTTNIIQNGGTSSDLVEIARSRDIEKLSHYLRKREAEILKLSQEAEEAQRQAIAESEKKEQDLKMYEIDTNKYLKELEILQNGEMDTSEREIRQKELEIEKERLVNERTKLNIDRTKVQNDFIINKEKNKILKQKSKSSI